MPDGLALSGVRRRALGDQILMNALVKSKAASADAVDASGCQVHYRPKSEQGARVPVQCRTLAVVDANTATPVRAVQSTRASTILHRLV